ncbi:MAG: ABC transporter ATP-binding protein [Candidatus Eiseniibacteriota bacterium]|nr:MAG: ABC transporter ATP-binding protein [Candidatus Eisenbacteria bacterium]
MEGISKQFALVKANDCANLDVNRGEIHALVGENGAGKSTLMRILYGLYRADSGRMYLDGDPVELRSPADAISLGIGMVHQHFMLVPPLSVTENVVLGSEPLRAGVVLDLKGAAERVKELSETFALAVDPDARVEELSVGAQQRVEIVKILFRGARLLILDEPTAVLTPQETESLFVILRRLKEQGKTIIFITHKLSEVMEISDSVTVMRHGKVVGDLKTAETNTEELATLMVGRKVLLEVEKGAPARGETVLELKDVHALGASKVPTLRGISLRVCSGEILGVAGVQGNGQTELVEVITGLRKPSSGSLRLLERDITGLSPREMLKLGVAHIPEDRLKRGLVPAFTVSENLILGSHFRPPFAGRLWLRREDIFENARSVLRRFDVRPQAPALPARSLSGGNQQKLIVGRELSRDPKLLVASQPTRGVDIGAIEFIHRNLIAQRDRGCAVLLVSADLSEILSLSDRIAVIYEGRIVGTVDSTQADEKKLGMMMMTGVLAKEDGNGAGES